MREILFRGKPIVPRKYNGGSFAIGYYCCSPSGKHYIELSTASGCKNPVEVNPDTVGQYTGLTDKNGKKIFEGDVVRHVDGAGNDIGQIYFDERTASFRRTSKMAVSLLYGYAVGQSCTYEVIGNIYDNPELMEVEK